MGVVYLAEQDEPVQRVVAIKVLRAGSHTDEIVARFESERQALALMDHPNITRVYDAGVTEAGLPYFVMERVTGVPITEYSASRQLGTEDRLRLIVQVCRAVQHAHQKGIIHRDIKPSNVLVAEVDGEPLCKVIDFGIAKAITPSAESVRLTMTGMVVGTPAYMSPEQFMSDGADIDTRTDIYSLGIMLYELISGALPFDPEASSGWRSLMAKRASGEIPPPSEQYAALELTRQQSLALERSTDLHGLRRALAGDLDSIVLKALEHDRELRYSSASALASDLEHYLANEPVSARPTSATYRIRKFVRRHRAGVAFSTTLIVTLVTVAIGATVQARRLAVARASAVARQSQAEKLISFMLLDLRKRLEPIGKLDLLDEVGNRALDYFTAVPESELTDEEQHARSKAFSQIGDVRLTQGKLPEAARLMQASIRAIAPVAARDSLNPKWQIRLADSHFDAGQVEWQRGNIDAAVAHFEPMLRISDRLLSHFPDSLAFRAEVAYALNNVGQARERKGDARAALASYKTAQGILDAIVSRDTTNVDWLTALAVVHNAAGVAERKLGDLDAALRDHQQELAVKERILRRDTTNVDKRRLVAIAHTYLSDIRLWRGDAADALTEVTAANAIYSALVKRDSTNVMWSTGLVNNQQRIGQVLLERGDAVGALRLLDQATSGLTRLLPANASNAGLQRTEATTITTRARALVRVGRASEATGTIASGIAAGEAALAKRPGDLERRKLLADSYLAQGDLLALTPKAGGATTAWARALVLVDSLARSTKETDYLVLQAGAMLRLGGSTDAKAVIDELTRRGYRRPSFVELARVKGIGRTE
jgi:tetratricopeptide (TPR) repeat protein